MSPAGAALIDRKNVETTLRICRQGSNVCALVLRLGKQWQGPQLYKLGSALRMCCPGNLSQVFQIAISPIIESSLFKIKQ
jgi:hypothetical protein